MQVTPLENTNQMEVFDIMTANIGINTTIGQHPLILVM